MKFSIDRHIIIEPLKQVASALPSKDIIPILSGILFVVDQNGLTMTAGNSHVFISATIGPDDFEVTKPGIIVIPGNRVLEIVQKASSDLTFEAKGLEITIKSSSNKFKLMGNDPEEYPPIPTVKAEPVILEGTDFKKMVRKTVFATANEKTETVILMGVNFEFFEGRVRATATDRTRMARTELTIDMENEFSTVVSRETLNILMKIVPNAKIEFQFGDDGFIARMKGIVFYSRVLEGTFPNIDRIIETSFSNSATFKTSEMLSALENVEIIAREEKVRKAKMTLSNEILIESNTSGGDAAVSVGLDDYSGEGIVMNFNLMFVIEALKALDTEQATINVNSSMKPIYITSEGENSIYLVLPYRVRED
ncbi:MAG TPA: DNA polymerase III subunit beta [Candidatus Paenibacillus intestinavium]|nr:DNA polymerase III subunit beta [Candidatus Paenibacillus intestinavium]